MSLKALIELSNRLDDNLKARFGGRLPTSKEIIGYSKGHWLVEYTFSIPGGYSIENHWEQDERSIAHQKNYPND